MKKLLFGLLAVLAVAQATAQGKDTADYLIRGKIRTMETAYPENNLPECIVIRKDTILYIGNYKDCILHYFVDGVTKVLDYKNNYIVPGFIDAHAHIGLAMITSLMADLSGTPYGTVTSIPLLQQQMKAYIQEKYPNNPTAIAIGNNYDDSKLELHQHPTRQQLDAIDSRRPIYVMHVSGHMGVGNTKFLEMLGINGHTPADTFPGGTVVKDSDTSVTGLLLENANVIALGKAVALMVPKNMPPAQIYDTMVAHLLAAEKEWFSYGITTICEGRADSATLALIMDANEKKLLTGDYIVLPDYDMNKNNLPKLATYYNKYTGHFKLGAVKFTFDGSPQGKDAFLSQPYHTPLIGQDSTYIGAPIYTYQQALADVEAVQRMGLPVHIHMNGDSAISWALQIFETLQDKGIIRHPTPNVMIHCQTARKDQLQRMKKLGDDVMQSFFPIHVWVWGDWYKSNVLDTPRANYISPLGDAQKLKLRYTIHTDAPVTPPDLVAAMYAAVNRITLNGDVLGYDQHIEPYRALQAITSDAAYQWGEQKKKGMLKSGYKADITILDKDVVTVDPKAIKDIKVLCTFKDGKQVFQRK
ncbi:amidohydrolase [Chitinophaga sp. sic0106]|uniref:amidohydrolase n=1 Tax=Chitinophaga sp. sic0106 TaxID=2854785 RepID=UPI001C45A470|nr:amidohydrolase [Chitinophaga sp. sic0106]MBV7530804.1 amidohydrolase [Chitinophaga sp. sic0106]